MINPHRSKPCWASTYVTIMEGKSVFAPGFRPVEFSDEEYSIATDILDVKITYAHWAKKMGVVQIRVLDHFISYDRISYWAKEYDLIPTTIYSVTGDDDAHLQINFQYR